MPALRADPPGASLAMIFVCGEALVDLIQTADDQNRPSLQAIPGGGPANVAVALARLGHHSVLVTRLGADAFGDLIRAHLHRNHVDETFVIDATEPTTISIVTVGPSGDARYCFYFASTAGAVWRESDLPQVLPRELEAIHVGSMALVSPEGRRAIGQFVERACRSVTISLDPNIRPSVISDLKNYRRDLEGVVACSHLVRVSDEDLKVLYPRQEAIAAAKAWADLGPRFVVVSRGAQAPLAILNGVVYEGSEHPAKVVDTVGAGDSFSAALLDAFSRQGLLRDRLVDLGPHHVVDALEYASLASRITCERRGSDPPTAQEIEALVLHTDD